MKTKEAIVFVKKHNKKEHFYPWERRGFKDVIYLLQRGEKFEAMWGELLPKIGVFSEGHVLEFIEELKQKYFPKEVNK